jgi:hypothetical protein
LECKFYQVQAFGVFLANIHYDKTLDTAYVVTQHIVTLPSVVKKREVQWPGPCKLYSYQPGAQLSFIMDLPILGIDPPTMYDPTTHRKYFGTGGLKDEGPYGVAWVDVTTKTTGFFSLPKEVQLSTLVFHPTMGMLGWTTNPSRLVTIDSTGVKKIITQLPDLYKEYWGVSVIDQTDHYQLYYFMQGGDSTANAAWFTVNLATGNAMKGNPDGFKMPTNLWNL